MSLQSSPHLPVDVCFNSKTGVLIWTPAWRSSINNQLYSAANGFTQPHLMRQNIVRDLGYSFGFRCCKGMAWSQYFFMPPVVCQIIRIAVIFDREKSDIQKIHFHDSEKNHGLYQERIASVQESSHAWSLQRMQHCRRANSPSYWIYNCLLIMCALL